ncbi:MAG: GIY-YIG nuclease family protein [Candidatus Omnitrophica bacterium]|nr:GIY-YIG nuclease family protein [Candidatus Omnitrophota bacterium]
MNNDKFYTYILISKDRRHTYTGSTSKDPETRLCEHNSGKVKSSKCYVPYEILNVEEFNSLVESRRKEHYYKTTSGRRKIKELIQGEPAKFL